jgi:Holliday junction resolvase RusA-like endonuclease
MSEPITFWAAGQPVPYNRESARYGRTHPRNAAWRNAIRAAFLDATAFAPPIQQPSAVALRVLFFGARSGCDGDNLSKEVLDALNRVAYEDDSQVRRCVWEIADWRPRGVKRSKGAAAAAGVMVTIEVAG